MLARNSGRWNVNPLRHNGRLAGMGRALLGWCPATNDPNTEDAMRYFLKSRISKTSGWYIVSKHDTAEQANKALVFHKDTCGGLCDYRVVEVAPKAVQS